MENDLRIAAAVMQSVVGRVDDNLRRMSNQVRAAAAEGVQVICFPELGVTGYSHRDLIRAHAEPIPGRITDRLGELAEANRLTILAGMAETAPDGRCHASHVVVGPDRSVAVYRKIHLAPLMNR
jgi:predicted amidohydrolase